MHTKTKILIYLILFSLVDMVIPVPITGLVLIYVVLEKPAWFFDAVRRIYQSH